MVITQNSSVIFIPFSQAPLNRLKPLNKILSSVQTVIRGDVVTRRQAHARTHTSISTHAHMYELTFTHSHMYEHYARAHERIEIESEPVRAEPSLRQMHQIRDRKVPPQRVTEP